MNQRIITDQLIHKFEGYLYEEEKSCNTIDKYIRDVCYFAKYAGSRCLQKTDVLEYKEKLCEKFAPRSVNSMLSTINAFFSYLEWNELKVKTLKIQRKIFAEKSKELYKSEYQRLLTTAKNKKNKRLYYLIQTIGSTGLRVSELKYVTCKAVRAGLATIHCKGKIRQVILPDQLCKMLLGYIKAQHIKNGSVFVSKNGKPLNRSNIWKMLKNLCSEANVAEEKVFPHNFRHLFARTYYSIQKDIVRLADILGHSNINTTRIYTIESSELHRKQLQQLGLLRC